MKTYYSLVSLWDMIQFDARKLLDHTNNLQAQQVTLSAGMVPGGRGYAIMLPTLVVMRAGVVELRDMCRELDMRTACLSAERLLEVLDAVAASKQAPLQFGDTAMTICTPDEPTTTLLNGRLIELNGRILDELGASKFLQLNTQEAEFFSPGSPLFGPIVAQKFPSLTYDITEAGKCLALGRSTASAFHSIRCLEAGFAAIWRCVGVPDPLTGVERNWSNRLRKVEAQLEVRWPTKTGRMTGDAKFFDEVVGAITAMQNPYRNSTMHLDSIYTEADAQLLFGLVKGIIQKIASRMDEKGESPA